MADMIEGNNMFYVSNNENGLFVPWHGKGVPVMGALNSQEAINKAGQAYLVTKEPVYRKLKSGEFVISENNFFTIRDTDESELGIVGNDYQILQNYQAFEFVDELLNTGVTYETAGVLENGKRVWLLARIPEKYFVAGDELIPYLCFSNSHDGKYAVRACVTGVKVVCNNTEQLAFNTTPRMWSVRHNAQDIQKRVQEAFMCLGLAQDYYKTLEQESNRLAGIQVDYDELVEELFPINEENDGKRKQTGITTMRNEMHKILELDYLKKFKNTAWGFVDGVSHFASHTPPMRKTSTYQEKKLSRIVCGDGLPLIDKAYELVLKKVA
jgi:phage/plasmid-like protein (TIGR03299 family)